MREVKNISEVVEIVIQQGNDLRADFLSFHQ